MKVLLVILGVIVLVMGYMVFKNNQTPDLGVVDGQLKTLGSKPNGVSTQVEGEKSVEVIPFVNDLETSKKILKEAYENYGDSKLIKETNDYLYVVFTTGKMKYNDDVEFYFDEANQVIHVRSESRIGYSDMGLNRERYDAIVALYNKIKETN